MKIWTCYDGLLQQTWTYGANGNLISLANNQCLDVRRESGPAGGVIYGREKTMQTWTCSSSDPQQRKSQTTERGRPLTTRVHPRQRLNGGDLSWRSRRCQASRTIDSFRIM
jgi:hypothetical protein